MLFFCARRLVWCADVSLFSLRCSPSRESLLMLPFAYSLGLPLLAGGIPPTWSLVSGTTPDLSTNEAAGTLYLGAEHSFPENKKENRGSPALCVSGNFQGKQRVFGAPFWKLASFPESESWSGAKSEAKLRKSTKYPGGRRVISRYTRVLREIPGILPIWPKIWLILGPNQPQTRLRERDF